MAAETTPAAVPPEAPEKKRARVYMELLVAVTGLIIAITAYIKPETSSRKTYDVLARQLEKQSEDIAKTHDDVVALRNYIDGYTRAQAERGVPVKVEPIADAGASSAALLVVDAGVKTAVLVPAPRAVVKVVALEKPPPPPSLGARPGTYAPQAYKSVTGTDDIR